MHVGGAAVRRDLHDLGKRRDIHGKNAGAGLTPRRRRSLDPFKRGADEPQSSAHHFHHAGGLRPGPHPAAHLVGVRVHVRPQLVWLVGTGGGAAEPAREQPHGGGGEGGGVG